MTPADALYQAATKPGLENARNQPAVLAARIQQDVAAYTAEFGTPDRDGRVPGWVVDRGALESLRTDPAWREHLAERYDYIAARFQERGATIAAEQPTRTAGHGGSS